MHISKSHLFHFAGCAAAAFLCTSASLAHMEPSEEPSHDTHAPAKIKAVKAAPKAPAAKQGEVAAAGHSAITVGEPAEKTAPAAKPAKASEAKEVHAAEAAVGPDEALTRLTEGNARWVSDQDTNPHTDPSRRKAVADDGQTPFVTVLTCADSRIPVERVFDQGVGDVFVIRVAGNIAGMSETGTIEYGAGHLHTPLLVVMGHTKCGAVGAAASHAPVHGMVAKLVDTIAPAVDRARKNNPSADDKELAALAVKENVWQSIFDLYRNSAEVRELVAGGKLKVIGAVYDISSGKVDFMGPHPWQSELLAALSVQSNSATANAEPHEPAEAHESK